MKSVVQEDVTGYGLACVATLTNVSYQQIKTTALGMGITVTDSRLWSDAGFVRTFVTPICPSSPAERTFVCFLGNSAFPYAPLTTKWHLKNNQAFRACASRKAFLWINSDRVKK